MLDWIVGKTDEARLRQAWLGNTRCHLPGKARRFPDLLPALLLPHLITAERLLRGATRANQQGREVPMDMLVMRRGERWHLRTDALASLCARGLSFVLNGVDEDVPAIGALSAAIERDWRVKCWTNAYWSHGRASAFAPHADDHNVLILQLSGRKHWRCWGPLEPFPVTARSYGPDKLQQPEWEGILQPGDALFVPRGDVHVAELAGPSSLHLTVAVRPPWVRELPAMLWAGKQEDEFSRHDVPVQPGADFAAVESWVREVVDTLDTAAALDRWDRTRPPYSPSNLGVVARDGTLLASPFRRRIPAERQEDGSYQITPAGWPLALAAGEWQVLDFLHTAGAMTSGQLTQALPGGDARAAADALIQRGLLFALEPSDYGVASWQQGA